ncbi:hypothetical protein RhiirA5_445039 [Rhizophagus irregularis]|uniref:Uncharacterized protein n=1 Tax=Rhizophagus irregularis TaxID=588596 RepID=A0A2I1FQQ7_9GLOM|nr:hypothetical protein RhiirA5_445039 [Rhizophagus irregularis]PKY36719.1 hypothetical protein RhiirB3_460020 [Rhizophagus irregularis]
MSSELELLRQRITELEAENTKLRQIIEENSKREAESAKHKVRIEELEKNSLNNPTNMQNLCSVGEEDISSCVSIAKQHVADNSDIKSMEERETDAFLVEVYKQ